jgi:UDP-N-acetylmuramoyl-tripeptide--D-alanyl-D-alanine ligase
MRWTVGEIAAATRGDVHTDSSPEPPIEGVSIDTRTLRPGELFVAVKAERDGHEFAAAALQAGAAALLVERPIEASVPQILVPDTSAALLELGRAARGRLSIPVAGITGSVGKTSTKDLAAAAAAAGKRTVASPRSFNNELGLPLTMANAADDVEVLILEMGARGPGHIAVLAGIARPTIGVVTSVAAAHTEMFGDLDGVAGAKGELVEALPAAGTAVLNAEDDRVRAMRNRTEARVVFYSTSAETAADIRAEDIRIDADLRPTFEVRSPWGRAEVRLEARGAHQVGNALAALAVAALAGVDLDAAAAALRHSALSPFRMQVSRSPGGAVVINDTYNANPASMAAALRALRAVPASTRIAVLGPMAELGPNSVREHVAIAALARELGIEVVAIGTSEYGIPPEADRDPVVERLLDAGAETAVLVKASRVAGLEELAARLTAPTP